MTIVTLNQGQAGNRGKIFALENINIVGGNLAELKSEKAVLPRINLLDAQLYKFNRLDADLYQAGFSFWLE